MSSYTHPTLRGWKPSTSLLGSKASMTASSCRWDGKGNWSSSPSTWSCRQRSLTTFSSCSCEASSGRFFIFDQTPAWIHIQVQQSYSQTCACPDVLPMFPQLPYIDEQERTVLQKCESSLEESYGSGLWARDFQDCTHFKTAFSVINKWSPRKVSSSLSTN